MKKRISLLLAALLILALYGCGGKEKEAEDTPTPSENYYEPVEPSEEPTPKPVYVKIGTVHNVDTYLNIRSGPGTAYDVLGKARSNDRFLVLTEYYSENWHQVEYNGGIAYIHADYLIITEELLTDDTGVANEGDEPAEGSEDDSTQGNPSGDI